MTALQVFFLFVVLLIIGIAYERNRKRKSKASAPAPAPAPVVAPWSPVGRWAGQLVPGSTGTWGGANDEHDPKITAQVLAQRPDWKGLGYCPGGEFEFVVNPDGVITGAATIYGVRCDVQGRPAIALDGREIEFIVMAHMVRLKFDGETVGGKLWEGHDELKRATIAGRRA